MASPEHLQKAQEMGLNHTAFMVIALVELVSVILFLIPRTGILGTLLLAAYMGGAIVAHLLSQQSVIAPCIVQAFVWFVAVYRFPELRSRLFSKEIAWKS